MMECEQNWNINHRKCTYFFSVAKSTTCNFRMPNPNMNSINARLAFFSPVDRLKHYFSPAADLWSTSEFLLWNRYSCITHITTPLKGISFHFIIEFIELYRIEKHTLLNLFVIVEKTIWYPFNAHLKVFYFEFYWNGKNNWSNYCQFYSHEPVAIDLFVFTIFICRFIHKQSVFYSF